MRENEFPIGGVDRTAHEQPRRGIAKIAQRLGAGIEWKFGTSPGGTAEILTSTLQPLRSQSDAEAEFFRKLFSR